MIVMTMTPSEMLAEVLSEIPVLLAVSDSKQKKANKIIRNAGRYPCHVKSHHTTRKNNRWLMCWVANNKKMVNDNCLFYAACLAESPEGTYVMLPQSVNGKWKLLIFSPHFFGRYAERHKIDKTGIDLRHHYLLHNSSYHLHIDATTYDGIPSNAIMATITEGMILGIQTEDKDVFVMKTFVGYDMLKDDQIKEVVNSEITRQEVHGY